MYKVVLLRHGESEWNHENRFTGWNDERVATAHRRVRNVLRRSWLENLQVAQIRLGRFGCD